MTPDAGPSTGSIPARPTLTADQIQTLNALAEWLEHRAKHGRHSSPRRAIIRSAADLTRLYITTHS